jgi:hypothetical protein
MPKMRLVVSRPVPDAVTQRAAETFDAVLFDKKDASTDEVLAALESHHADALFLSSNT